MLWHVVDLDEGKEYGVTLDYTDTLELAVTSAKSWRRNLHPQHGEIVITKGPNGEPLRYVVWYREDGKRPVIVGAYRTERGAARVYNKISARHPDAIEYGWATLDSY